MQICRVHQQLNTIPVCLLWVHTYSPGMSCSELQDETIPLPTSPIPTQLHTPFCEFFDKSCDLIAAPLGPLCAEWHHNTFKGLSSATDSPFVGQLSSIGVHPRAPYNANDINNITYRCPIPMQPNEQITATTMLSQIFSSQCFPNRFVSAVAIATTYLYLTSTDFDGSW